MRPEKKYLVEEVGSHLDKSDYVFVADYTRITVAETAELRKALAEHNAEFHVVKNSVLQVAAQEKGFPSVEAWMEGPNAIIVGGSEAPAVAKALEKFFKSTQKVEVKGGLLEKRALSAGDVKALAQLPPADVLKAQLLSLFNTPATQMARIIQGVPQGLLNVLQAKADLGDAA